MAAITVTRHGVEAVRRGHPWIFRSAMGQLSSPAVGPRIVSIVSEQNEPIGSGV